MNNQESQSSCNYSIKDQVTLTVNYRCNCGSLIKIPLNRDWSSPLYIMHMEKEHKMIRETLCSMKTDLLELAEECVEAGVRPEILKRADALRDQFSELKKRFGI